MSRLPSRRDLLRGAGGAALALPWLEAAGRAAGPRRFILFFTSNGTNPKEWVPTTDSGGRITRLSPMLAPLEPFRDRLLLLGGLNLTTADMDRTPMDEGHAKPYRHMLTAAPAIANGSSFGAAGGISIDQEIARRLGTPTRFRSLEFGVQVPGAGMSSTGPRQSLAPMANPKVAFDRVFKNGTGATDPAAARERARQRSVLDALETDYARLTPRLGGADRRRIEAHLAALRELEVGLAAVPAGACAAPDVSRAPNDTTDWNAGPAEYFLPLGRHQMDLLASAVACDLTRVASIEWRGSGIYQTWLGPTFKASHHDLSHASPAAISTIQTWFAEQFAYLLGKLAAQREGTGTVLDSSVVVWLSEIGEGATHSRKNVSYVVAGGAGGALRTGRFLHFGGAPHGKLFVSLMNAMGIEAGVFGDPRWCDGPLAGLG